MRSHIHLSLATALLLSFIQGLAHAQPLSTAFTYQGQLKQAGTPLNAVADFEFRLFTAPTAGTQVGSTQAISGVSVSNGLFTVLLDFGSTPFSGSDRWLEIAVRTPAGAGNFTTLSPRQRPTATPYALYALTGPGSGGPWAVSGNNTFTTNTGNVGVGTATPATKLHISGTTGEGLRLQGSQDGPANLAWLAFRDVDGTAVGYVGDGGSADNNTYLGSDIADVVLNPAGGAALTAKADRKVGIGTITPATALHVHGQSLWLTGGNGGGLPQATAGEGLRLYYDAGAQVAQLFAFNYGNATPRHLDLQDLPGANVGIGTPSPLAKLDVRGDIRLGASGQYRATSGEENLRLLRGNIDGNGTIDAGSGFTCQRINEGIYKITFLTPFSGVPTVTATAVWPFLGPLRTAVIDSVSSSQVTTNTVFQDSLGPGFTDSDWSFCVIGPR